MWYNEFWCQYQRREKPVGARCLAHLDEQGQHAQQWRRPSEAARCGLPHHPCFDAVEAVVTTLATQKLMEPRVDVDSWRYRPLPHIRLARRCGRSSPLFWHAKKDMMRHRLQHKQNRTKASNFGRARGGVGVIGISLQPSGRSGQDSKFLRKLAGYNRAVSKAAAGDGGGLLQDTRP